MDEATNLLYRAIPLLSEGRRTGVAAGDRTIGGGGGARLVYSASLRRTLWEAGLSTTEYTTNMRTGEVRKRETTGTGRYPSGAEVYQAARRQQVDRLGQYVIRIHGYVNTQWDSWRYAENGSEAWLARTVNKFEVLQQLEPIRFGDGGDGAPYVDNDGNRIKPDGPYLAGDGDRSYHNSFLHILSDISEFGWDRIETVQFYE